MHDFCILTGIMPRNKRETAESPDSFEMVYDQFCLQLLGNIADDLSPVIVDTGSGILLRDSTIVILNELAPLFGLFLYRPKQLIQLAEIVDIMGWQENKQPDKYADVYLSDLRNKLEPDRARGVSKYIETVRGRIYGVRGYRSLMAAVHVTNVHDTKTELLRICQKI